MRRAAFAIPAITATLAVSGCVDPLVGEWEASRFPYAEAEGGTQTVDMPYEVAWDYELITCRSEYEASFEIDDDDDLTGDLKTRSAFGCSGGNNSGSTSDTNHFDVEAKVVDKRATYEITIEDLRDDEDVTLDCELSDDKLTLECEGDDDFEYEFEKVEED